MPMKVGQLFSLIFHRWQTRGCKWFAFCL